MKDLSNRTDFFKEAIAACELNHENIVEFLGIVKKPNDMIIFEYMEGGQLLNYLKVNQRMENPLPISDMIEILIDICKGCAYMELMKFVHRDLAARNCLLTSTDPMKRKVKICKAFHYSHWRRSALNSAGALVQGGDGEFRGIFILYYKFSGIV